VFQCSLNQAQDSNFVADESKRDEDAPRTHFGAIDNDAKGHGGDEDGDENDDGENATLLAVEEGLFEGGGILEGCGIGFGFCDVLAHRVLNLPFLESELNCRRR
jgi:hypothetical protein